MISKLWYILSGIGCLTATGRGAATRSTMGAGFGIGLGIGFGRALGTGMGREIARGARAILGGALADTGFDNLLDKRALAEEFSVAPPMLLRAARCPFLSSSNALKDIWNV